MAKHAGSLRAYMLTRLALMIPMVLILVTMVFVIMRVIPGDPLSAVLGARNIPPEEMERRRAALGLDQPLVVQYFDYLGDIATLNFGDSIRDNRPVREIIINNGGATLTLTVSALVVALLLGLPLGLFAGRRRDTIPDIGIRLFGIVSYAAPVFFTGLLLQILFASSLGWLPPNGQADPIVQATVPSKTHILLLDALIAGDMDAVGNIVRHLILPAVTLGLLVTGVFLRLTRVNVVQAMGGDYIEAAKARGVPDRIVVRRHAFRNALVPVITVMGLQVALLLGGAILTERTFSWPGLGTQLVDYLNSRDYIAVQGIITVFALVVVVISLLIDFVNALIDPRVRY